MFDLITWLSIKLSQLTKNELLIIILLLLLCGAALLYPFLLVERFSAGGPSNRVLKRVIREVGINKSFRVDEKGKVIVPLKNQKKSREI